MAHKQQLDFVQFIKDRLPQYFQGVRVLEIGSLDIKGSVRGHFENCDYTGLDVAPGKGVDVVGEGQNYDAPDDSFDVVIACEVMEHNPYWKETFDNMIRMIRPGGMLIMSCASIGREEHGTARSSPSASPLTIEKGWDYYRNLTAQDVESAVDLSRLASVGFATDWTNYDLYMIGVKKGGTPDEIAAIATCIFEFKKHYRAKAMSSSKSLWRALRKTLKKRFTGDA